MLQHNPALVHEVCIQHTQREKTVYQELFSGDLTETGNLNYLDWVFDQNYAFYEMMVTVAIWDRIVEKTQKSQNGIPEKQQR